VADHGYFKRAIPSGAVDGAAIEGIGMLRTSDPVEGVGAFAGNLLSDQKIGREMYAVFGGELRLVKVATQLVVGQVGNVYPDKGGALPAAPAANGGTTLTLNTAALQVHTGDPTGLLVVMTSGAAVGRARRIVGWNDQGNAIVDVHRAWATAEGVPAEGDTYELLVDCRYLSELVLKTEYETDSILATVNLLLWDFPFKAVSTDAWRAPLMAPDYSREIANLAFQGGTGETNYYHGQVFNVGTRGFLGAQVRLRALTGGKVSFWMGAR